MISSFKGEHRFLSNFWPCQVEYEGYVYPSVEHAYVSAKISCTSEERKELNAILAQMTAGQAKKFGKELPLREDWNVVRLSIMQELLLQKFNDPELKAKLLATGDKELVEGNTWGDKFWGVCDGEGSNHLGRLLMRIRSLLQS